MPNVTFYVTQRDRALWEKARAFAKLRRVSLSSLLMDALRWYLERLTD